MVGRAGALSTTSAVAVALPLLLSVGGGACASKGAANGAAPTVAVEVGNDLQPRTSLAVRIVSDVGIRRFLGRVPPSGSATLWFRASTIAGAFRLEAETADGRTYRSRSFNLHPDALVRWALPSDALAVGVREVRDSAQ